MTNTLLIKNGHIVDPAQKLDQKADILIENGKISKIGKSLPPPSKAKIIDAKGKIVSPGFIDIHVHLREPGREDKETLRTASKAAAKGGITTVVGMPNTNPIADNQTVIEFVLSKAKRESLINIQACGSITKGEKGQEIAEIWEMKQSGAIAVSDDGFDIQNLDVYRKALQYCKTHDMPIISHTEDVNLAKDGQMHEGTVSTLLGLKGIPACAEDAATARIITLVEDVDHRMHFTHVSSKGAIDMIKLAQHKHLPVTADTTPHHFSLTDEAVANYDTNAKVNPPLRSEDHRQAILKGLKDGTLSCIVTDHAPHLWTEKQREFQSAPAGIVGFETMLSLIITNLVNTKVLTLSEAIAKITINPAKTLSLPDIGTLKPGSRADITIFDPKATWTVDKTKFESKGMNTPFHGMKLYGVVTDTFVKGKQVLQNGKICSTT
ncbi:dihydroorotase [Candidatus Peregrinibacteria bacterium]|jgi:dihydroorotase|nr:dihydroorotase [Candidatus Peregrinibacteria bacterium]MBT4147898.1 dihydroorotase [Candidatus Peregrinibacteria bacterium]MBT4365809.1 dihydroorotase [Candidatus Peregrinibacteria bacterium]MBT4456389.1 dihydroorotase [Candidatus Peregrinibacteria bacterium]